MSSLSEARDSASAIPVIEPILDYYSGLLAKAVGDGDEARTFLNRSAQAASSIGDLETECYAMLELCAVETWLGRLGDAEVALSRAQATVCTPRAAAAVLLRGGALAVARGDAEAAIDPLVRALELYKEAGVPRETGWAGLHLAESCLAAGQTQQAVAALLEVAKARAVLSTGAPLLAEFRTTPRVIAHLGTEREASALTSLVFELRESPKRYPLQVAVDTFGTPQIRVDALPVRIGYRLVVPVLAYLRLRRGASLNEVVRDLFVDVSPTRAKNYFHQVRHCVKRRLPGISITMGFDKLYRLEVEATGMRFDFELIAELVDSASAPRLDQALALYSGPFLEGLEGEWVEAERARLEAELISTGIRVLEDDVSSPAELLVSLGFSLLDVDPGNVAVGELLVARLASLSPDKTVKVLSRLRRHYLRTLEEVPETIARELAQSARLTDGLPSA